MCLKIKAIYLKNMPKWQGYDLVDEIPEINYQVFRYTVEFSLNYYKSKTYNFDFKNHQESSSSKNSKIEWFSSIQNALTRSMDKQQIQSSKVCINSDICAIPGGRYGCAQFIKTCGPKLLQDLSLGHLAFIVQLSVQYGVLRYHKTLLIWTNKIHTTQDIHQMMQKIQDGSLKITSQE